MSLRRIRDEIKASKVEFSKHLKELIKNSGKTKKELIKFIISKTGKKDSTVRTLLSDVKISDDLMGIIEGFFNG